VVEIWENNEQAGVVACTSDIQGDVFINDGVQGGTPTYRTHLV